MPRGDKTGPMGMGPMTGRAAGYCAGSGMPGYANPAPGRGFGMGFGRGRGFGGGGRGWRNMFYATGLPGWLRFGNAYPGAAPAYSTEAEMQLLKSQAEHLSNALDAVNKRLSEMEQKKDASE